MREDLVKAYNIIKEEQRNADNKANLFIVLITGVITFIGKIPSTLFNKEQLDGLQYLLIMLLIPLMLFVISLIPIYNHKYILHRQANKNDTIEFNIFYWKSIFSINDEERLMKAYRNKYDVKEINNAEIDLLKQIRVNANIMERKSYSHKMAFYILGQIVIFIFLGALYTYLFQENKLLMILSFILIQLGYYFFVFGKPSWLRNLRYISFNKKQQNSKNILNSKKN